MTRKETDSPNGPLLIVGASARAAAMSARRAGYRPFAIDLFGDRDLTAIAETRISADFPRDIPDLAKRFPDAPFVCTGAIENDPRVLDSLNRARPALTNPLSAYRTLRDPFTIASLLRDTDLPALLLSRSDKTAEGSVRWLKKPFRSGGGLGIGFWDGQPFDPKQFSLQEYREGIPSSALFVSDGRRAALIGVTRQLVGLSPTEDIPFLYCGNIANWPVPETTRATLARIGNCLIAASGLKGLFGIDFILTDETPWLVEVNPRYTASVELFEAIDRQSLLQKHVESFSPDGISPTSFVRTDRLAAKLIVYPQCDLIVPADLDWESLGPGGFLPAVADLPQVGTRIASSSPLCTLFAEGKTRTEVESILRVRWMQLSEQFDKVVTDSLGDFPGLFSA